MKGIIFCIVLCFFSLNAMPSGLDNRLPIIEGLRRKEGADKLREEIADGITEIIYASTGLLVGLGLKVLDAIGEGLIGIGDRTSRLTAVGDLERRQLPLLVTKNVLNSLQQLDESKRGEISDSRSLQMDRSISRLVPEPHPPVVQGHEGVIQIIHPGVPSGLRIKDGSRRKAGVDVIGKEFSVGVPKNNGISPGLNAVETKLKNPVFDPIVRGQVNSFLSKIRSA